MRIDHATDKYALIITTVIHLGYICKNVLRINFIYWCYYVKLKQGIWMLLGNSFSISEGKSQSTLLILSFKLFLRGTWN